MPKTQQQKQKIVEKLTENFSTAKSVIFACFDKLGANQSNELRKKCRQAGVEYMVTKKTLLGIAAKEAQLNLDTRALGGQVAVAFGKEDEVAPAKVLQTFGKGIESFSLVGGVLEGKLIDAQGVLSLATLPSRDELLAKLVGSINAPLGSLLRVLGAVPQGLVQALHQIAQTKK